LCTTLTVYNGSRKLCSYAKEKYCIKVSLIAAVAHGVIMWSDVKNKRDHLFLIVEEYVFVDFLILEGEILISPSAQG